MSNTLQNYRIVFIRWILFFYFKFCSNFFISKNKNFLFNLYGNIENKKLPFIFLTFKKSKLISRYMKYIFISNKKIIENYVKINEKNKEKLSKLKKNIILVSHYGAIEAIPFVLNKFTNSKCLLIVRNKQADFLTFFKENDQVSIFSLNDTSSNVYDAIENTLNAEGNVVIFADGFYGKHETETQFLGKKRYFKIGFAKVALAHNVEIISLFIDFLDNFKIEINVHDFFSCDSSINGNVSIDKLINQYSKLLATYWDRKPEQVALNQHLKYLEMKAY